MKACFVLIFTVGLIHANANSLGAFRKRFNGNPEPGTPDDRVKDAFESLVPPDASCCKPLYRTYNHAVAPWEQNEFRGNAPGPPGPSIPPPVRPNIYFQTESYRVFDKFHSRELALFDPEGYIRAYPGIPFPKELDIPVRWYVYNAVTVQAPKPFVDENALRLRRYTGFYYACPENVSPYKYAWYMRNDPINPCKWIFYQSLKDAEVVGRPVLY